MYDFHRRDHRPGILGGTECSNSLLSASQSVSSLLGRVSVVSLKRRGRCSCVKASFDHSTFSRNRARVLEHETAGEFFRAVVAQARTLKLLLDEHFTVDGTVVEAWASLKSFKRKDAGPNEPRAMRGFRT